MDAKRPTRSAPRAVSAQVASAQRRLGLSILIGLLAPAMAVGGGVAALAVLVLKLFGSRLGIGEPGLLGWVLVVIAPVLLAALFAGFRARRRWPSALAAASVLDEASDTHDLLGSSLVLAHREEIGFFERETIREAEGAASRAATKEIGRLEFGPRWIVGLGSVALAGVLAWLAPMREPPLPGPAPIVRTRSPEAVSAASDKVASAKEAIEAASSTGQVSQQELSAIEELERELAEGLREPEDAVAAAAETLQRSAEEAAKRAEREQARSEAVEERLSSVDPEGFEQAQELAQDLSEGDFESAAAEAERLLEQMKTAPDEVKQQFADELRRLAEEIERQQQARQDQSPEAQESQDSPEQETQTPQEPPTKEEIQEQLEREGVPPEDAERLAEEIHGQQQQEREQEQAEQEAKEEAERVAEELRREADQLSPPDQQEQNQEGQRDSGQQQEQSAGDEGQSESSDRGEPQQQPANSPQGNEQGQGQQQESESQSDQNKQQSGDKQGEGEGEKKEGQTQQGQTGEGQEDQQPKEGEGTPQSQPSDSGSPTPSQQPSTQPGNEQGAQPGQQSGQQPGNQDGAEPGEGTQQQEGAGDSEGQGQGQNPGLGETLRRMAEQRQRAQDAGNAARDLQRRADELNGQAPGGNDLRDAADRFADQSPWEGQTEFVDARSQGETDPEREDIIAEWFNPSAKPGESAAPGQIDPGQSVQQAEQRAQRALEQQAVPRRHADLIKRVFNRFGERAKEAAPAGTPPPTDAKDAP